MRRQKMACFCAAAVLLAGCAGTPKTDIVTRKNTEALAGKAVQEDENRTPLAETKEQAPETYTWSYDNTAGTVHIDADAEVTLPEKNTIPMYRLNSTGFTQEQVTGIYDYLFQGRETYRIEGGGMSKAECEEQIVELKKELEDLDSSKDGDNKETIEILRQNAQESLDGLMEIYDTLPEEDPEKKIPVDATLTDNNQTSNEEREGEVVESVQTGLWCQSDAGDSLSVDNEDVDSSEYSVLQYRKEGKYQYAPDIGEPVRPGEADEKIGKSMPYSYEEAKALADGVIEAAGVEAELVETTLVEGYTETQGTGSGEPTVAEMLGLDQELAQYQDLGGWMNPSTPQYAGEYTAFQFQYARVIEGTPVAATSSNILSEDATAISWPYEQIVVLVSEAGIQKVDWDAPVVLGESVANDVPILSFEDARAIFEELAPLAYEGKAEACFDKETSGKTEAHVNQVRLSLMRVKNDGSKREGLYVPAWVFYGTEASHFHSDDPEREEADWTNKETTPWIVLAVNAVDGTVIDQVEGY
ncbi:MAG TPA: hypothetical protein DF613_11070 [Lachnospiraceae bacterium]|nr:hypothetical protein [Lachnospiraceae bacterium]